MLRIKLLILSLILSNFVFSGVPLISNQEVVIERAYPIVDFLIVYDTPMIWEKGITKAIPRLGTLLDSLTPSDTFFVRVRERGLVGDSWVLIDYGIDTILMSIPNIEQYRVTTDVETLYINMSGWILESLREDNGVRFFIEYILDDTTSMKYKNIEYNIFGILGLNLLYGQSPETFSSMEDKRYHYPFWRGFFALILIFGITFVCFSKWTCSWFPVYKQLKNGYKFLIWLGLVLGVLVCVLGITVTEIAILLRR